MRKWIGALAFAAMACGGGGEDAGNTQAAPAAQTPAASAPAAGGAVHEVNMLLRDGKYIFEPAALTIKTGDRVKWINVSGGPHNVAFHADRNPARAADILNAAMPNRMAPLAGPFIMDSLAVYEISFANAPTGQYSYTCQPHEALGMNATLTIQQ
jgi:plastocyanin